VIYYNQIRPEFLATHGVPLSSDVFSPFARDDPNKKQEELKLFRASAVIGKHVSDVARKIENRFAHGAGDFSLTELMHR